MKIQCTEPTAIVGFAEITQAGHPDPTAFDPDADHFDPKSDPYAPTWFQVTVRAVKKIEPPITLAELKQIPELAGMELLRKGSRLSVQPVKPEEWAVIQKLVKSRPKPKKS